MRDEALSKFVYPLAVQGDRAATIPPFQPFQHQTHSHSDGRLPHRPADKQTGEQRCQCQVTIVNYDPPTGVIKPD